jgi:uncharacterized surface anchored protein
MRGLLAVPIALLLAGTLLAPSTALAAEPTTGYSQEPNKPSTSTTPAATTPSPTPAKETSPSKESGTPSTGTAPAKESAPSSTAPSAEKAATLPFTGLDLRWMVAVGFLLMGAGFSIVLMQRRQRRNSGR